MTSSLRSLPLALLAVLAPLAAGLLVGSLLIAGCGTTTGVRQPAVDSTPPVPWQDYAPGLQARIDGETCDDLQAEFDRADANNPAEQTRAGHNNADLMTYIDWRRQQKGCP